MQCSVAISIRPTCLCKLFSVILVMNFSFSCRLIVFGFIFFKVLVLVI